MASVDETVRQFILAYPNAYKDRRMVLENLFLGHYSDKGWQDGEIVLLDSVDDFEPWTAEKERQAFEDDLMARWANEYSLHEIHLLSQQMDYYLRNNEEVIARFQQVVDTVDERIHMWSEGPIHSEYEKELGALDTYAQYDCARLMNVPEDVKPDWREAAEQMKVYAAARGWVF